MVDVGQYEGYLGAERGRDGFIGLRYGVNFGDPRCTRQVFDARTRQRVVDLQLQTFVVTDQEYEAIHYPRQTAAIRSKGG